MIEELEIFPLLNETRRPTFRRIQDVMSVGHDLGKLCESLH